MPVARLLLVDDHQIMRDGLRLLLAGHKEWKIAGSAFTCEAAWTMVVEQSPDLVLMDLDLRPMANAGKRLSSSAASALAMM